MNIATKLVLTMGIAGAAVIATPKAAHAEDCLEVGWKDKAGAWVYYKAHVDGMDDKHLDMHYDYKHGQLELKFFPKEKSDGENVIVFKGRWFEGKDATRTGKVRLELEKGHHRAKGWYTYGNDPNDTHFDLALRECK